METLTLDNSYILVIVALLPLTALMVVTQQNPYHALIIRGILGAVAALVYALLGAADVALTEALVGTMLAITLYAVAVRSSLQMQVGVLAETDETTLSELASRLRPCLRPHHLRLEFIPYDQADALHQAMTAKTVHAILAPEPDGPLVVRVQRLHDLLQAEFSPAELRPSSGSVSQEVPPCPR